MDFNTQFVSFGAKAMKIRKCDKVIYIMTVVGICKCNTERCHTDTYLSYMHIFTTVLWDTDEYRDCSEVTEQHGRRKKSCFMLPS